MFRTIILAAAAASCLLMSACVSAPPASGQAPGVALPTTAQVDAGIDLVVNALGAAQKVYNQDVQAGLIDAGTATKVGGYVAAVQRALLAAEDAYMVKDAATEQERLNDATAALIELNSAILAVVQATGKP